MMRDALDPDNALVWYTVGVNRFLKNFRLQNSLSRNQRIELANSSEAALLKSQEIDPSHSFTYAYINMLYRNIHSKLYPQRSQYWVQKADSWMERFGVINKRERERERLEKELQKDIKD